MIAKPQGYDEAQMFTGESAQLPAGCYICAIKQVREATSRSGRPQLAILFDIAEGEHKGFYQKQYDQNRQQSSEAKWKGVYKQITDGTSLPFFKGVITSIEKSNNFQFPWGQQDNEKVLVGKKFGAVMGREEFIANDSSKKFATKIFQIRSLDGLKDAKVPEDKLLAENTKGTGNIPYLGKPDEDGFMRIPDGIDEELPFN